MTQRLVSAAAAALLVSLTTDLADAAVIQFISETSDYPSSLSSDGGRAVIHPNGSAQSAIWSRADGTLAPLPALGSYALTAGAAMSADGAVVVGKGHGFGQGERAFRWTSAGGMQPLADPLAPTADNRASNTNADGSVVIGTVDVGTGAAERITPWRWTAAGGVQRLSGHSAYEHVEPMDLTADGSVIVGTAWILEPGVLISHAFRWTQASGFQLLPDSPNRSWASAVSADGSVIAGWGEFDSGEPAFRWTSAGGFQQLPSGGPMFRAEFVAAMSADGSVLVGQGNDYTRAGYGAFMWGAQSGTQPLTDGALSAGLDLQGQYLESATAISADGTIIVGRAFGPAGGVGYVLVVPEPTGTAAILVVATTCLFRRRRATRERRAAD